jgi:serine/threonine-protein kinase
LTVETLILGRYRLEREIAAGGTARVWEARDEQLDRRVAVKLLHPHLLPDEASRRRLVAEARAAAALSHPGIATVYDVSGEADEPTLVMELVDGEPLSAILARDGPMRPEAAAQVAAEVAEALYHAHQQGIIHRDVKPANVMVESGSWRARLIDFGIAHSLERAALALTQTGTTLGTPRYMAPEQLAGDPIGPRTDLWGVGATLYEALSGRPAFDGSTPLAIARQQEQGPPPLESVDRPLAGLVRSCLSVDVDGRPLHAGALAAALRAWLAGEPVPNAAAISVAETQAIPLPRAKEDPPVAASTAPASAAPELAAADSRPRRRLNPVALLVAGFLLLAALVGGGLALSGGLPPVGAEPTVRPTASPTPNWRAPLLADYQEACGESLEQGELSGMSPSEASAFVDERIQDCQDAADEDKGGGKGKGKGHGNGNGNGGEGRD